MSKFRLMLSAAPMLAAVLSTTPAFAQNAAPQNAQESEATGDIIVTATRRSEALSDVPLAVSAVTAATLQNSGASDIRALNQLSPSLLVSSTSSEAAAGGARIRGIGTVGDNPGLESSVATFVDGVYRNRSGVGLSELGAIDRIEVLRGTAGHAVRPQRQRGPHLGHYGQAKSFNFGAEGEATLRQLRDYYRFAWRHHRPNQRDRSPHASTAFTVKRDGFLRDVISGRTDQ